MFFSMLGAYTFTNLPPYKQIEQHRLENETMTVMTFMKYLFRCVNRLIFFLFFIIETDHTKH